MGAGYPLFHFLHGRNEASSCLEVLWVFSATMRASVTVDSSCLGIVLLAGLGLIFGTDGVECWKLVVSLFQQGSVVGAFLFKACASLVLVFRALASSQLGTMVVIMSFRT